jgi:hypothetical protein
MPEHPSWNAGETTTSCAVCGAPFQPVGRQRCCRPACRQVAWRRRHPTPLPSIPERAPRASTVYECPGCGSRSLGEQYCTECGTFARRVGPGGCCPSCDEPVALVDLLPELDAAGVLGTTTASRRDTEGDRSLSRSSPQPRRGPVTQRAAASGGRRGAPLTGNEAVGASQAGERSPGPNSSPRFPTTRSPPDRPSPLAISTVAPIGVAHFYVGASPTCKTALTVPAPGAE